MILNSGPQYPLNLAVSLCVGTRRQEETDRLFGRPLRGRATVPARVAHRQVQPVGADRSGGAGGVDERPRSGAVAAGDAGDAGDTPRRSSEVALLVNGCS